MLPNRRPKPEKPQREKREKRWRSPAHTKWLTTEFNCCNCGSSTNVIAAHYRFGSNAGIGQKPDDWRTTPLCDGPFANIFGALGCHQVQHQIGEPRFWEKYQREKCQTVDQLIDDLCRASPKAAEIKLDPRARVREFTDG